MKAMLFCVLLCLLVAFCTSSFAADLSGTQWYTSVLGENYTLQFEGMSFQGLSDSSGWGVSLYDRQGFFVESLPAWRSLGRMVEIGDLFRGVLSADFSVMSGMTKEGVTYIFLRY